MVMKEETIKASEFKARCLALLDEVTETGGALTVTKRGRPVARVVPVSPPPSLVGSVAFEASDDELIAPLEGGWDATRE